MLGALKTLTEKVTDVLSVTILRPSSPDFGKGFLQPVTEIAKSDGKGLLRTIASA